MWFGIVSFNLALCMHSSFVSHLQGFIFSLGIFEQNLKSWFQKPIWHSIIDGGHFLPSYNFYHGSQHWKCSSMSSVGFAAALSELQSQAFECLCLLRILCRDQTLPRLLTLVYMYQTSDALSQIYLFWFSWSQRQTSLAFSKMNSWSLSLLHPCSF